MKSKIYLDNSVFGGYYDLEFKKPTRILFSQIEEGKFEVYISDTLDRELRRAPKHVQNVLGKIPNNCLIRVTSNKKVDTLALEYIKNEIITDTHFDDTMHIATAAVFNVSMLISWNFKHIVNSYRIPLYNKVNKDLGYNEIQIVSPPSIIY